MPTCETDSRTSLLDQVGTEEGWWHRRPFVWALAPEACVEVMPSDARLVTEEEDRLAGLVKE